MEVPGRTPFLLELLEVIISPFGRWARRWKPTLGVRGAMLGVLSTAVSPSGLRITGRNIDRLLGGRATAVRVGSTGRDGVRWRRTQLLLEVGNSMNTVKKIFSRRVLRLLLQSGRFAATIATLALLATEATGNELGRLKLRALILLFMFLLPALSKTTITTAMFSGQ